MFTILILWLFALPSALPHQQKRCSNALKNPSFEDGLSPWLDIAFGSWLQRGVFTSAEGGHAGPNFYFAQSNATVSHTTLTLSQSDISIPAGTAIDCSVWIASNRPGNVGSTHIDVFMDQVECGNANLGTNGWVKIGGKINVEGDKHTMSIVIVSDKTGPEGSKVWVDDALAGVGC